MVYCIVQGCHNDSKYTKGVSYYRLMSTPFNQIGMVGKVKYEEMCYGDQQ